jgi:2-polyprenyl-3-methyl-5-hydroxy-6-metoxy-1,4-benzoquinol methylase
MTSGRSRKLRAPPRQLAIRPRSWNACSELDAAMQERLADVLETRGADPQQQAMRYAFLANIAFPENAHILEVGCGTGVLTRALACRPEIDAVAGVDVAPPLLNKPANWPQTYPTLPFRRPTLGPCPSRIKLSMSSSSTRL